MNPTEAMLKILNETFPDLTAVSPLEARALAEARIREPSNLSDVARVEDSEINQSLRVRQYIPHVIDPDIPVTVYAHGGGFLHGSIASHDGFCRRWSRGTGSRVVSVGYRLAPDVRGPAPVDDFLTACEWAQSISPDAGLIVAGDSAGANLAAVAALEYGGAPSSPVRGQVLLYPFLDPTMRSESYVANAEGYFVSAKLLAYYWNCYLGDGVDRDSVGPRINPALAASHAGLPPAIVITAGLDPLRDEGKSYANTLSESGVSVIWRHYPDQFHGFATIPDYAPGESARSLLWEDFAMVFCGGGSDGQS